MALPQEWLAKVLEPMAPTLDTETYQMLAHCTEKTNAPASIEAWKQVFDKLGAKLEVLASGCCGMSGTYGHETRNVATSVVIYGQSWQPLVAKHEPQGRLLADGYSCRSQVKRQDGKQLQHPLQVLLARLRTV